MDLEKVSPQDIEQISKLPKLPAVMPATTDERLLFLMHSSFYIGLSLWLKFKLGGQPLPPEALEEPAIWLQPYAEYYAALHRLAIETYQRTSNLDLLSFPSPKALWLRCVEVRAQQELEESGMFGLPARVFGKLEAYRQSLRYCELLLECRLVLETIPTIDGDPETLLIVEAQKIAKRSRKFRNQHFFPFVEIVKDVAQAAYKCENLQCCFVLPAEGLFMTGKNVKLAKRKLGANFRNYERKAEIYEKWSIVSIEKLGL
jgi:hypothetical protein